MLIPVKIYPATSGSGFQFTYLCDEHSDDIPGSDCEEAMLDLIDSLVSERAERGRREPFTVTLEV